MTIGFEVLSKIDFEEFMEPDIFFTRLQRSAFIDVIQQQIESVNHFYNVHIFLSRENEKYHNDIYIVFPCTFFWWFEPKIATVIVLIPQPVIFPH